MKQPTAFLEKYDKKWFWFSIGITVAIFWVITIVCIYVLKDYVGFLFFVLPFFMGAFPSIIYGIKNDLGVKVSFQLGAFTMILYLLGLLIFKVMSVVYLLFALPLALGLALIGIAKGLFGFLY